MRNPGSGNARRNTFLAGGPLARREALVPNDAGSSLSNPGAGCRRDAARPRWHLAPPYARGCFSSRPGAGIVRCFAPAVAIAAPGRSHASSRSTLRWSATRARLSKSPPSHRTIWRADFDSSLSADVLELFHSHDQPAVVFTDRGPDEADFIVAAYPTGRDGFDDYVDQNREHAEIDERWLREPSLTPRSR